MYGLKKEAKDLLPEGYTNPASPNGNFTKRRRHHGCMV